MRIVSIAVLMLDSILLILLVMISGRGESWYALALPYIVLLSVNRLGETPAVIVTGLLTVFMFALTAALSQADIFRYIFWMAYFGSSCIVGIAVFGNRQTSNKKYEFLYKNMEKSNSELERRLHELEKRLSTYTIFDPVTGLKNFRYLRVRVEEEISRARRQKYPFSICIIGIDDIDVFENRYGAQEKDRALVRITSHLNKQVRDTDLIGRYVNDQFVLLLPQANPKQTLIPIMRIKKTLDPLTFGPDNMFTFTYSAGVAGFPDDVQETGGLFGLASAALDRSRERGPGSITFASSLYANKLQV